jgi:hypothetical protein
MNGGLWRGLTQAGSRSLFALTSSIRSLLRPQSCRRPSGSALTSIKSTDTSSGSPAHRENPHAALTSIKSR